MTPMRAGVPHTMQVAHQCESVSSDTRRCAKVHENNVEWEVFMKIVVQENSFAQQSEIFFLKLMISFLCLHK